LDVLGEEADEVDPLDHGMEPSGYGA
jgi:hypothetical protein